MPDPETEVAYLFGSPKVTPNRVNVGLTQQLDWGVLTGRKRRVARAADNLNSLSYENARRDLLAEIGERLTERVYYLKLCEELEERLGTAREIERLYAEKFNNGAIGLIEWNKVKLNTRLAESTLNRARAEMATVEADLTRLNGGKRVEALCKEYKVSPLRPLSEIQEAVAKIHPSVAASERAVTLGEERLKLEKANSLPALSVGYVGEYVRGTGYSGVSLGLSLPLWGSTRAKVRTVKAENEALRLDLIDSRTTLAANVAQQYEKALTLSRTAEELERALKETADTALLRCSLDEGQLSLLDYLLELSFYYEARTARLEAERDARQAVVALESYFW